MLDSPDPIAVRDQMVAQAAGERPFFDTLRALGAGAIELQVDADLTTPHVRQMNANPFSLESDARRVAFKTLLAGEGVRLSAVLLMTDFSSGSGVEQVAWTTATARIAAELGAPVLRVDPLTKNKALPAETARKNFVAAIQQALHQTADTGVELAMENHGQFGNDPEFIDAVFADVPDPRLGMTLDIGNFYWWGVPLEELYALLRRYAPRAMHTHIKNIKYPPQLANARRPVGLDYANSCCSLDEGNIDLRRVVEILLDAGYRRDFCIENESLEQATGEARVNRLKRDVAAMRSALSAARSGANIERL